MLSTTTTGHAELNRQRKWQQRASIIIATVNLIWSLIVCARLCEPAISFGAVFEISLALIVGTTFMTGLVRVLIGACFAAVLVSVILPAVSHGPDATPQVVFILGIVAGMIVGAIWHDSDWPSPARRKSRRATNRRATAESVISPLES